MKAWFNEKNNWCFEFERDEEEVTRFIILISDGVKKWREDREKFPKAFISAELFDYALGEIFIGQNYGQTHPTIENPMVVRAKDQVKDILTTQKEMKWNGAGLNEAEIKLLTETKDINEIL